MPEPSVDTQQLHVWINRIQSGDQAARNDLIRGVLGRLEQLARKMLRRFPNVHRWADTDDVLQSALMRLLRGLQQMEAPSSMREFYALAAQQLRRELLDLARHFASSKGPGCLQLGLHPGDDSEAPNVEPASPGDDPGELDAWCCFHQEVDRLPPEEREIVGLIFYHGWKQAEVADLFGITERTVRRRWASALEKLQQALSSTGAQVDLH
jgi:RNA polymerase sigma-70 factor (ECF subfamily)